MGLFIDKEVYLFIYLFIYVFMYLCIYVFMYVCSEQAEDVRAPDAPAAADAAPKVRQQHTRVTTGHDNTCIRYTRLSYGPLK